MGSGFDVPFPSELFILLIAEIGINKMDLEVYSKINVTAMLL